MDIKPPCPNCPDRALAKNGRNDGTDTQRYRCTACGYSMTDSANIQGAQSYGAAKRSNAEHQSAHRRRKSWQDEMAQAEENESRATGAQKKPPLRFPP